MNGFKVTILSIAAIVLFLSASCASSEKAPAPANSTQQAVLPAPSG